MRIFPILDNDDGHAVRSARVENPGARKLRGSVFYRTAIIAEWCYNLHCGSWEFRTFCCCDLDLDPMTYINEIDPFPLKMYSQTKNELSTSTLSKVIVLQTGRQTYRQDRCHPHRKTIQRRLAWRSKYTNVTSSMITCVPQRDSSVLNVDILRICAQWYYRNLLLIILLMVVRHFARFSTLPKLLIVSAIVNSSVVFILYVYFCTTFIMNNNK